MTKKLLSSKEPRVSGVFRGIRRTRFADNDRGTEFRHQREKRFHHEGPRPHPGMGKFQSGLLNLEFTDQQEIKVEGSGLAARAATPTER